MTNDKMLAQLEKQAEFKNCFFGWTRVMSEFGITLPEADRLLKYGERIGMLERIPESGIAVRFVPEKLTKVQLEIGDL